MFLSNAKPIHPIGSIFLDQSNLGESRNRGNNTFTFKFQGSIVTTDTSTISVSRFSVPYSWFNITESLGNNKFSYSWRNLDGTDTEYPIVIPNGHYAVPDINALLQYEMIKNGHTVKNIDGTTLFYIEMVYNFPQYRIQFNSFPLPTIAELAASGGVASFPVNELNHAGPMVNVPTGMCEFFGLTPRGVCNIPALANRSSTATVSVFGDMAPLQNPVHSIVLTCDAVDNPLRNNQEHPVGSGCLMTQPITKPFGDDISPDFAAVGLSLRKNTTLTQLVFTLTDQRGKLLMLEDLDTNIELNITDVQY